MPGHGRPTTQSLSSPLRSTQCLGVVGDACQAARCHAPDATAAKLTMGWHEFRRFAGRLFLAGWFFACWSGFLFDLPIARGQRLGPLPQSNATEVPPATLPTIPVADGPAVLASPPSLAAGVNPAQSAAGGWATPPTTLDEAAGIRPVNFAEPAVPGATVPVRLKFTLGGEKAVAWEGHVRIKLPGVGHWETVTLLSIEPKAVGLISIAPDAQQIVLRHLPELNYQSFAVDLVADPNLQLEIQLRSPDNPQWSIYQAVSLAQLLERPWSVGLSNSGHGLWVERVAEDAIRFETSVGSDVLVVAQPIQVRVVPNRLPVAANSAVRYDAVLSDLTAAKRTVWEEHGELTNEGGGHWRPLTLPNWAAGPTPGVYQLEVSFSITKSPLAFLQSGATSPVLARRRLQWVVVPGAADAEVGTFDSIDWSLEDRLNIEPAQLSAPSGFQSLQVGRLAWLPRAQPWAKLLPESFASRSSENLRTTEIDGKVYWELGTQQWRSIELPALEAGCYAVEVEWLDAPDVSLGLDLVQADRWGRWPHWTTGSQWTAATDPLTPPAVDRDEVDAVGHRRWRTFHWVNAPEAYQPAWLCLAHRGPAAALSMGNLRIQKVNFSTARPSVAAADTPTNGLASGVTGEPEGDSSRRSVGYYVETPLLSSLFVGRKPSESASDPPLNDWLSYQDATDRLVEHLRVKGYGRVWLPVLKQGGALFPTAPFQSSPRFENSVFGGLGQGEARLDVVGLLLHKLDQQQLTLMPVFDFSTPLPRQPAETAARGSDERYALNGTVLPQSTAAANAIDSALTPAIPWAPESQRDSRDLVDRFVARYRDHPSLAGVALELGPDSPWLCPDEWTGLSSTTAAEFLNDRGLEWPIETLGPLAEVAPALLKRWVSENASRAWWEWRADRITRFFVQWHEELAAIPRPAGLPPLKLQLVVNGLVRQPQLSEGLYPSLRRRPEWNDAWLKLGLQLDGLRAPGGPGLVVQQAAERGTELAEARRARTLQRTPEFWQAIEAVGSLGYVVQQATRQATVEALSDSPSDHAGQTPQGLSAVTSGYGCEVAWAGSLWRQDLRHLLNQVGGVPRTDYPAEARFSAAFQRLRDESFTTLYQEAASPVAIRQSQGASALEQGYAVNAAPWPVTVVLQVQLPEANAIAQMNESTAATELTWRNVVTGLPIAADAVVAAGPNGSQAVNVVPVSSGVATGASGGTTGAAPSSNASTANTTVPSSTAPSAIGDNSSMATQLDGRLRPAALGPPTSRVARITLELPPHSLTVWTGPRMALQGVTIVESTPAVATWLQAVRESLFRRLRQAATNAVPLTALQDPGFDGNTGGATMGTTMAWTHGQFKTGQQITRDSEVVHGGTQSLRLVNPEGVLWLRSASIPPPKTGRLSITAWVRNHPQRPAPAIRLAIDGQTTQGAPYYRFAEIPLEGSNSSDVASSGGWQPVAVHFDDLPEEGLVSVRVGFDMMQAGELWIDSVQCFDRWFDVNDQKVLSNRLGLATFSLENKKNLWATQQALDDYWLRFLLAYVPDPNQVVEAGQRSQDVPATDPRLRNARGRRFLPLR